ncbi:glycosyltransferase [Methylocystis bryophila]|uniref:Glycosyl transferase family 2 n=1 Tax=Methylocystis bryophila TaxID=655015 RepID=A0A1W6MS25_9HYPH|nr:glycosyltransferase [Methylocystis bryophila]ARN80365.1 glycosyl transferase family 2 [Methylocystis bryophila]BDV40358.1 glycosyl transferase [Methylocystis bryophila]
MHVLAGLSLLVWLYLLAFRGSFWRLTERERDLASPDARKPKGLRVTAITPARDEAQVIEKSLSSLLAQRFGGAFDILLVDDQSADGTADLARACAERLGAADHLSVLRTAGPASGWTGKLSAMNMGLAHVAARGPLPDFLLFCDADIALAPDVLDRLVTGALARDAVLVSLMARLRCESAAERWFVPAFVFFFQMLYPFAWVNDPKRKTAAAAGGVMLVRPQALIRAGGFEAIRDALIDDCALGALMKKEGPIWLGLAEGACSLRAYPEFKDIEAMVVRSAFAELRYSPLRLIGAVVGMGVVYFAPPLILLLGEPLAQAMALAAYALMTAAFMPILRDYGVSRISALALPGVAACYTWFTIESALKFWRGEGGFWKGRLQAPTNRAVER